MGRLLILFAIALLTACATPYQRDSLLGGYSDMALAEDIYKVSFRGNGYSSKERVQENLLRRAAELTSEKGYKYFIILAGNTNNFRSTSVTPTTINSNSYGSVYGTANNYTNGYYHMNGVYNQNSYTTINPSQTIEIDRYTSTAIIKMLKSNQQYPIAMNASIILKNFTK